MYTIVGYWKTRALALKFLFDFFFFYQIKYIKSPQGPYDAPFSQVSILKNQCDAVF